MPRHEANPPASAPDDEALTRLNRLSSAMELFLQFRESNQSDRAALLQQHEDLRDLLEPMFADLDEESEQQASEPPSSSQDESHPATPDLLQPGRQVGDYRIVREAGRGGMGTVFEAQQISLDRRVALKVLHPHLSWSAGSITRFRNEAAAAARLQHAAIVPIYEVGEWHGLHFFSMEFVDGQPLNEVLHKEHLGIRKNCTRAVESAELIAQVADALQHAHGHSLVHRDVKPQNIMITTSGSVRLLDFGLVKNFAADSNTAHGAFFGTPHYCSPEQAQHDLEVGPQTDVFSLAIVLYELVTRHRPFDGETTRRILQRIEAGVFRPLRQLNPAIPRDLETICHKALETDPAARYATAGALAEDLRRFLRIEPIKAKPPGAVTRAVKWVRRNRMRVALWAALSIILVGGAGSYMLMQHQALETAQRERKNLDKSEDIGFQGIEQVLTLLNTQLERSQSPPADGHARVDEIVRLCQQFLNLRAQDENRRLRVAAALDSTSNIYRQLGQFESARDSCELALEIVAGTAPSKPHQRIKGRLLLRKLQVGQLLQPTRGAEDFAEAIAHLKPLCLPDDADARTSIIYAETLLTRAKQLASYFQQYRDAEKLLLEASTILAKERFASSEDFIKSQSDMCRLRTSISLGIALLKSGQPKTALEHLLPSHATLTQMPRTAARSLQMALATTAIGQARESLGQRGAEEQSLREVIDAADSQLQEYPGAHALRHTSTRCRVRLSNILLGKRQFDEAEQLVRDIGTASRAARKETPQDRYLRAQVTSQLAACILLGGGPGSTQEGEQLLQDSCRIKEQLMAEQPDRLMFRTELGGDLNNLAAINNQGGNHRTAVQLAKRAIALQQHVLDSQANNQRATLFLGMHFCQLATGHARLDEYEPAVSAALSATKHAPRHLDTLRISAAAAARCVSGILRDTGNAEVNEARERYAGVAIRALRQLRSCDAGVAEQVLRQSVFDPLRDRSDFQALTKASKR